MFVYSEVSMFGRPGTFVSSQGRTQSIWSECWAGLERQGSSVWQAGNKGPAILGKPWAAGIDV